MDDIVVNIKKPTTQKKEVVDKKKQRKEAYLNKKQVKYEKKQRFLKNREQNGDNGQLQQEYYEPPQEQHNEEMHPQEPTNISQKFQREDSNQQRDQRKFQQKPKRVNPKVPKEDVEIKQYELPAKPTEKTDLFTLQKFAEFDFISQNVKKALGESGYQTPTQIQQQAMLPIFQKKNTMVTSQTGSGKTLAYMVPLFSRMSQMETRVNRESGTFVIIVCPVRELAIQCLDVAAKCGKRCPFLVSGGLLGGENPKKEKSRLRKGVNILVGTPGRINYHLKNTQSFNFKALQAIVFEEWDRLLDMGFKKDIQEIIDVLQEKSDFPSVQKILVSAHVTNEFQVIPALNINPVDYQMIGFEGQQILACQRNHKAEKSDWLGEQQFKIPKTLSQFYTLVNDSQKVSFLVAFVAAQRGKKAIIFVATCDEVEYFATLLTEIKFYDTQQVMFEGFQVFKLHGNIEQKVRSTTYFEFRKVPDNAVLISTQVASRGLDFPDVVNIMVYDPPDGKDDYINKIGRTARIDRNGSSLLVYCDKFKHYQYPSENTREQVRILADDMQIQQVDCGNYYKDFAQYLKSKLDYPEKKPDLHIQQAVRRLVRSENEKQHLARRAYISFIRAYSRLQNLKVKAMNLHELSKSFGLEKAVGTETKDEKYQRELLKTNREKFREQGVDLNSQVWDQVRKKRRVLSERELNKMEFN